MKVCIVGGGGGASNAANVIRSLDKQAHISIFTNRGEIGNQPCEIPFVLQGMLPSWESSFAFRDKFYQERNIEIHFNTEVTEIITGEKRLIAGGNSYGYDKAILDLGANPAIHSMPGLDGYNEFSLNSGLKQARAFEEAIPRYKNAAIIGVGQIAIEIASILSEKAYAHIYLVGRSDRILRAYLDKDMAAIVEDRIRENGVELFLSSKITGIATKKSGKSLSLSDKDIEIDFVFLATGTEPNVELAQNAGIRIGATGAIAVNEYLQTSDPDIYAIGDCMENWERITGAKIRYQTATNAARAGRIAGRNLILGNVISYPGTVMPFVTEIFGYHVGTVGFTETFAKERGLNVVSSTTTTSTRRQVLGGKPIRIKLVADRGTRSLVGAQLIGEELVAGKIDRLAVAIAEKVTVDQLALADTCYSPTTGTGYEAVTMALDELWEKLS